MNRSTIIGVIAFGFFSAAVVAGGDYDEFRARLNGRQEVPPVETRTRGEASFDFDHHFSKLNFRVEIARGERLTQAHLHCAARGENGPVVAFLAGFHELGWDVDGVWIGEAMLTDDNISESTPSATCPMEIRTLHDLAVAMAKGIIYVNVHSVDNKPGEVRGQVRRE